MHSYKWVIRAFIALCFTLQSFSISHATSFGDAPHNHDGIECEITLTAADEDFTLPVPVLENSVESFTSITSYNPTIQNTFSVYLSRSPPQRGPPTLF